MMVIESNSILDWNNENGIETRVHVPKSLI